VSVTVICDTTGRGYYTVTHALQPAAWPVMDRNWYSSHSSSYTIRWCHSVHSRMDQW